MRQSQLFTKTRREAPADEQAKNAQLLIRAGYLHKEMAGVYDYLPLGLRVLENIKQVVREEMDALGCQELLMSSLQRRELWEGTHRWDDAAVDVWFKAPLNAGGEVGFGWSHEEPIGDMLTNYIASYKDLPVYVYQFQNKLRNELRAKSGVMRGREFLMKDAYTFCLGETDHEVIYAQMQEAYLRVFSRLGLGADTFVTFATGGAFTEFSHEFQTVCEAGEDVCYLNRERNIAINEEVLSDALLADLGVTRADLTETRTAEVGNIFNFGRQKATDLGLTFKNQDGEAVPVWMGSYGIGVSRLIGVLAEKFSDERGLAWPVGVAPYTVHLVGLNSDDPEVRDWTDGFYTTLSRQGISVLYDDRDLRTGEKFADSDLMGMPYRVVASRKAKEAGRFEVVTRASGEVRELTERELLADFAATESA